MIYDLDISLDCTRNYRIDNSAESAVWSDIVMKKYFAGKAEESAAVAVVVLNRN
jgi:hypothetical protein